MSRLIVAFLLSSLLLIAADPPIYYLLWFDTEDYLEPSSDDAAMRLADGLSERGLRATFKIVGEKARVFEKRKRTDVIASLSRHDIGYHSNNHSIPPQPAVYLSALGWTDGIAEFIRREQSGVDDLRRIFNATPSCYGQPGNSWGPQSNPALRQMGVPVYMDDGRQIGHPSRQPFWFGGVLYIFNMGQFTVRTDINDPSKAGEAKSKFDAAVAELRQRGGGAIHTYYHPTEFSSVEFWDGVNFRHGGNPKPEDYKMPRTRTRESAEQAYRLFFDFIDHVRKTPGIRFVTARDMIQLADSTPPATAGRALADRIDIDGDASAADQLLALLGIKWRHVDGPAARATSDWKGGAIPRWLFEKSKADARDFIERNGRLPDRVWMGPRALSIADFAATLAADRGTGDIAVRAGKLEIEKYIAKDARRSYDWVIHEETFAPESLLEMARLQAWTLRPARLRLR